MTRPIKFRGRDMTGHFVYGLLTRKKIRSSGEVVFAIALSEKQSETIPVNENSIAQLVGFDANGNEVYEGDFLVNDNGDGFFAELVGAVITDEGFLHADIPPEILKLKEATK